MGRLLGARLVWFYAGKGLVWSPVGGSLLLVVNSSMHRNGKWPSLFCPASLVFFFLCVALWIWPRMLFNLYVMQCWLMFSLKISSRAAELLTVVFFFSFSLPVLSFPYTCHIHVLCVRLVMRVRNKVMFRCFVKKNCDRILLIWSIKWSLFIIFFCTYGL